MKRSRIWLLLALLLAIALLASGCFQIRGLKLKALSLAANESGIAKLELYPVSMAEIESFDARVVLLIGVDEIEFDKVSAFDNTANWGGPFPFQRLASLRDILLTEGNCSFSGIDAFDMKDSYDEWRAYVTLAEIDLEGGATAAELEKLMKVNLSLQAPTDAAAGGRGNVVVFSAAWDDDVIGVLPGVPEAGEALCTGMVTFSIPYTNG